MGELLNSWHLYRRSAGLDDKVDRFVENACGHLNFLLSRSGRCVRFIIHEVIGRETVLLVAV
jgi:hypothetical protein